MHLKSRLCFYLYACLTSLVAPLGLLYLCYKKRRDPPYGTRAFELLGHYKKQSFNQCIWFHTVSVGEVIAARPVIQAFVQQHPKLNVIVTTTTTTGAKEVSKIEGITHVFAPLDSPFAVKRFLQSFHPTHLFIMETELWPCMLHYTHQAGTKIVVFNARMPEKTCLKYEKHLQLVRELISANLDMVICQTQKDADRFERIGVASPKLYLSNSLKYDLHPNEQLFQKARKIKLEKWPDDVILGAISTHDGEEALILETFYNLLSTKPNLKLVLVPRHKSGVLRAKDFLTRIGGSFQLRTEIDSELKDFNSEVLLGNTMGEIEFYLGLCDIVFMGGSFVDVGGHNPLEPAYFSIPIITGPYYYNFKEQYDLMIDKQGAYLANDHKRLFTLCEMFFNDRYLMAESGLRALDIQQAGKGALEKTLEYLDLSLSPSQRKIQAINLQVPSMSAPKAPAPAAASAAADAAAASADSAPAPTPAPAGTGTGIQGAPSAATAFAQEPAPATTPSHGMAADPVNADAAPSPNSEPSELRPEPLPAAFSVGAQAAVSKAAAQAQASVINPEK